MQPRFVALPVVQGSRRYLGQMRQCVGCTATCSPVVALIQPPKIRWQGKTNR
ncbi:hypothetical protein ACVILL_000814 [Bradyrhizobium sp. USDA 3364]